MKNAVNWVEIPVSNFERARDFYQTLWGTPMQPIEAMSMKSAFFPADLASGGIGGCIIEGQGYVPSSEGSVVYLNGGEDLASILSRVEEAGGKVLLPKTSIGGNGFMAHFTDSEGNKIGLHSRS